MSFCFSNLHQTCRIATKLIKSVLFFSLKWKYFQRTTKNIFFVYICSGLYWLFTYLFLNFCNWYSKNKNHQKGWQVIFSISPLKRKILKKYTAIKHNDFTRIFFLRITQYYIYIQFGYILSMEVCVTKFLHIHNLHIFLTCKIRQLISYREKPPYIIRSLSNHKFQEFPLVLNQGIFQ